mgnify:CR=1 FL=1
MKAQTARYGMIGLGIGFPWVTAGACIIAASFVRGFALDSDPYLAAGMIVGLYLMEGILLAVIKQLVKKRKLEEGDDRGPLGS